MVPSVISVIGVSLCFWVGMNRLGHSSGEVLWAVIAVQIAAGIALPLTLYAQRSSKLRFLVKGPLRSWVVLMGLSIGLLMAFCPWLRDLGHFAWMFFPLFGAVGIMILFWGPLHDRIVMGRKPR